MENEMNCDVDHAGVHQDGCMEAVKRYVSSDDLARIVPLPKSFAGKNLEIIIIPAEEQSEEHPDVRELLASIKGPVPDNTTTLNDIREERWKAYEDIK